MRARCLYLCSEVFHRKLRGATETTDMSSNKKHRRVSCVMVHSMGLLQWIERASLYPFSVESHAILVSACTFLTDLFTNQSDHVSETNDSLTSDSY
jgi:hypothetical protein